MRILKNKTAEECAVTYGAKSVTIPANDQADLSENFTHGELAASNSLLALLGQGVDKYQLNDGVNDLSMSAAIDLVRGYAGLRDSEGAAYVAMLPGAPGRKMCVTGVKFDANQNTMTDNDKIFSETREIQGAWLEVVNHEPGDYVELFVCMPDGTPVGQFGETVYIPPSKKVEQIVSEGTVSFPAGFKLRMKYVAVSGGGTRTVYGWYRMRK